MTNLLRKKARLCTWLSDSEATQLITSYTKMETGHPESWLPPKANLHIQTVAHLWYQALWYPQVNLRCSLFVIHYPLQSTCQSAETIQREGCHSVHSSVLAKHTAEYTRSWRRLNYASHSSVCGLLDKVCLPGELCVFSLVCSCWNQGGCPTTQAAKQQIMLCRSLWKPDFWEKRTYF